MIFWPLPNGLNFYSPKKDLMRLFFAGVARRLAITFLWIFTPVYIYRTLLLSGFSERFSILITLLYFFILFLSKGVSLILSEDLSQRLGFKGIIKLSFLPFFLFIPFIIMGNKNPIFFIVAAIFIGIHNGFYWWGYHGYFIKSSDKNHFGQSISVAGLLETVAIIIAPIIGALIATYLGFNILFLISGVCMLFSIVLLGKDHDKKQKRDINLSDVLNIVKKHKIMSVAYIGASVEGTINVIFWPLFLYLFFGEVISLGGIVTGAIFTASLFALLVGKKVDTQGEGKIVSMGAPLVAFSWLLKYIFLSPIFFMISDSLWNFGERMLGLPLNALTYKKAIEGKSSATAILFREMNLLVGSMLSVILIAFIVVWSTLKFVFIIACLSSLIPLAVYKNNLITHDGQKP
jgi:MFS family permease